MTLGVRLLILVLLAALPVFVLQVVAELEEREQQQAEAARQAYRLARLVAAHQDRLIEGSRRLLTAAAQFPEIRAGDGPGCQRRLMPLHEEFREIHALVATTAAGEVFCATVPLPGPFSVADRSEFREAVERRTVAVSGFIRGPLTGAPVLGISKPVLGAAGRVEAVVMLVLDLERVAEALAGVPLPPEASIMLLDSAGTILAHLPEPRRWIGENVAERGFARRVLEGAPGSFEAAGLAGEASVFGFAPLEPPAALRVAVAIPSKGIFDAANAAFWRDIALLSAVFALAALAALLGGSVWILRPVQALDRVVQRLAWGDLSARAALHQGGIPELRRLAASIDTMAAALQEHEAELQLAKDEAERATEAKTRFFAAASHDLRQPFQAMRLFLHLLQQRLSDRDAIEIAQRLGDSMRSGEDMLNALLDVSTLEAGTVRVQIEDVPLRPILDRLVLEFAPLARDKGLAFRSVACEAAVRSDPVLLERLLRNLLSNAVRYTQRGRILFGCRRRSGRFRIEVWDTGPGIADDQLPAIFEEFRQGDAAAAERGPGFGLGLSIVDRVARLLGHRLEVRSWPGRGSVFAVEVPPATIARPPAGEPAVQPEGRLRGLRVFVLEDDAMQRVAIKHVLSGWGCQVVTAPSLDTALLALESGSRPDVILADFRLPGRQTGFDAIDRIRQTAGAVPAVLLTGETDAARLGPARPDCILLHKPLDPVRLERVLGEIAGRGGAAGAGPAPAAASEPRA